MRKKLGKCGPFPQLGHEGLWGTLLPSPKADKAGSRWRLQGGAVGSPVPRLLFTSPLCESKSELQPCSPAHHMQPCLVHPQDEPRRARLPAAAVRPGAEQLLWTCRCISPSPATGGTRMSPFMGEETAAPVEWRHRDFRSVCLSGLHRAPQQSPTANPSPLGPPGAISAPPLVALLLPRGQVAPARLCCPHRPQRPQRPPSPCAAFRFPSP